MRFLSAALLLSTSADAMSNGLARTPPMGWSSWNCFGGGQSQEKMTTIADAIVSTGLRDLGYINLAIDGGWEDFHRGGPPASGSKGPHGWDFRNLSDHYHSLGLKLGMYLTGGFEAVYEQEAAWASMLFAEWNCDGLKVDHMCQGANCGTGQQGHEMAIDTQELTIKRWAAAIAAVNATDRVLFQNCGIGCSPSSGDGIGAQPWGEWCSETANMWRTAGDIAAEWPAIVSRLATVASRGHLAGPGGWNYPGSLEIGNSRRGTGLTPAQARAHFSLWSITSSPLILGNDVRNISADDLAVVSNIDAIFVNQAWAGFAGDLLNYSLYPPANASKVNITQVPRQSVWWKPLPNKSAAAVLFNSGGGTAAAPISFKFHELAWAGVDALGSGKGCKVKSVWSDGKGREGRYDSGFAANVSGGACFFAIISDCQ